MYTPIKRQCNNPVNEMASPRTPEASITFSRELRQVLQERNMLTAKTRNKVCSMLDGCSGQSPMSFSPNTEIHRKRNFRYQAVQEIITSERTYLQQLEILLKYFVKPLKEQSIIDDANHTTLFGQIEMIFNLNNEFLMELESDVENVAQPFLKMAPFFKLYSVYAFDYRNALLVLQELTSKNPTFRRYLELNESRPEVQRKLNSLMIIPIQRVPRYKLLLEQVLLYTSPADSDFRLLKESIKQIETTAFHINSCVEDQEVTLMLINLQNSLVNRSPNIVKPSRKVIKEGILQKVARTGTEIKRYCILMSDIFMYCKIVKDRAPNTILENSLECCCIFPLKKCKVYELLPGNFKITCHGDGIIFASHDLQVCRTWVGCIRDAIDLHIQCRKTLRKESSKRTPLRKKDVKHFGEDYILSPKHKRSDFETVFRSEDENEAESSFVASSCFCGLSNHKIKPISTLTIKKNDESNLCNRHIKRSTLQPQSSYQCEEYKLRNKELQSISPEKRFSKLYKSISNDKNCPITPGILKKNLKAVHSVNAVSDIDLSYGFASRYSDSKSYFRTQNIDNTIPRAVHREDLLQTHVPVAGCENFRDVLFPLRASSGSNKSNKSTFSIKENLEDFNAASLPQKKRVKFDDNMDNFLDKQKCFDFQCEATAASIGKSTQNSLRERIYEFFANLF